MVFESLMHSVLERCPSRRDMSRACFCGAKPVYEIPGTRYCYCIIHAQDVALRYRQWLAKGGHSRYDGGAA